MPSLNPVRLLRVADAARCLCNSLRTMCALIASGALPVIRVTPKRIAVSETDLAAYVASRREGGR